MHSTLCTNVRVFVRDTAFVRHFAVSDGTACCPFAVTSRPKINLIFCLLWLRASAGVYPCTGCTHFACAPAAGRQSMLPYSSKISINNRCTMCERGLGGGGGIVCACRTENPNVNHVMPACALTFSDTISGYNIVLQL